jgi:hypothetical protein
MDDDPIMTEQDLIDIEERVKQARKPVTVDPPPGYCHRECWERRIRNQEQSLADAREALAEVTELFNKESPEKRINEYDKNGKLIRSFLVRDTWMSHIRIWRSVIRQIEVRMAGKEPEPVPDHWGAMGEVDEL